MGRKTITQSVTIGEDAEARVLELTSEAVDALEKEAGFKMENSIGEAGFGGRQYTSDQAEYGEKHCRWIMVCADLIGTLDHSTETKGEAVDLIAATIFNAWRHANLTREQVATRRVSRRKP